MSISAHLQPYTIGNTLLEIFVPDTEAVQELYSNRRDAAYWAQVWPAAVGLCYFLEELPLLVTGKKVLELAAGLGLPGLYSARLSEQVHITDREKLAIECVQLSINHLQLENVTTAVMDWREAINSIQPELVLMSDVNYDPMVFEELYSVIEYFLQEKATLIISTPQRLMAKAFVNGLLPACTLQRNYAIPKNGDEAEVSVFLLENP